MANCLPRLPIRRSRNLHPNNSMRPTPTPAHFAFLVCLATIFLVVAVRAQDGTDRPPWARKSTSSSSTAAQPAGPAAAPVNPLDNPSEPPAQQQRGKIRVNVQL